MIIRTTQEIAQDTLFGSDVEVGLLNEICTLLQGNPTTQALQDAHKLLPALSTTILTWISSRNLIGAAPRYQAKSAITPAEINQARDERRTA